MQLGIRVIREGPSFEDMVRQIEGIMPVLEDGLFSLGNSTKAQMSLIIKQNKKRPGSDNVLEGAIKVYKEQTTATRVDVGVGNTDELDQTAPYWYFINYGIGKGGMTLPAHGKKVPGYFGNHMPPIPGGSGEQFHYIKGGKGVFFMQPKMPIAPMNYIEKTVAWVNGITKIQFDKMNNIIQTTSTKTSNVLSMENLSNLGNDYY